MVDMNILWPHLLFSSMYATCRKTFLDRFCGGDQGKLSKFWEEQTAHPSYSDHPMHTHPHFSFRSHGVPFSVHGDGTNVLGVGKKTAKHLDSLSWNPLLSIPGPAILNYYCIVFVFQVLQLNIAGMDTLKTVFDHVCWSFRWAYAGKHPDRDPMGKLFGPEDGAWYERRLTDLAGGFFLVCWSIRADLDFVAKVFKLDSFASNRCHLCQCDSETRPWTDARREPQNTWMSAIWTNYQFKHYHGIVHPLLRLPGMVITNMIPDILHTKHIGTDSYFVGGTLRYLTHYMGGTPDGMLREVFNDIRHEYNRQGTHHRIYGLSHTMIKKANEKCPQLTGPRGKCIRDLVPVLVEVFQARMDSSNEIHRNIVRGLQASASIDKLIMANAGSFRTAPADAEQIVAKCFEFAQVSSSLVKACRAVDCECFTFTIKCHHLLHLGLCSRWTNVWIGSCYQGEEMMAAVRKFVAASSNGNTPLRAGNISLAKYARGVALKYDIGRRMYP